MNGKQIPDFAESTVDGLNKHTDTHTHNVKIEAPSQAQLVHTLALSWSDSIAFLFAYYYNVLTRLPFLFLLKMSHYFSVGIYSDRPTSFLSWKYDYLLIGNRNLTERIKMFFF